MDTTCAVYFCLFAAFMVAGGILYQVRNWDSVDKSPKEVTATHDHHH